MGASCANATAEPTSLLNTDSDDTFCFFLTDLGSQVKVRRLSHYPDLWAMQSSCIEPVFPDTPPNTIGLGLHIAIASGLYINQNIPAPAI